MKVRDLTGQRFGKLTVISRAPNNAKGKVMWNCVCDCGRSSVVSRSNLCSGGTHSCGCLSKKHGKARKERLYNIWVGMRQRCRDEKIKEYERYGGRGIRVCDQWQEYAAFREWALANGYTDDLTIDRVDVNGNYEPSNCRWANYNEQNNNRRNTITVIYNNSKMTIRELAKATGMPYKLLKQRLWRGWTVERAVTTPKQTRKRTHDNAAS